jgi:hypothetical protein
MNPNAIPTREYTSRLCHSGWVSFPEAGLDTALLYPLVARYELELVREPANRDLPTEASAV